MGGVLIIFDYVFNHDAAVASIFDMLQQDLGRDICF